MALVNQVTLDPKDEPACLGFVTLTVPTNGTSEIPEIILLMLESVQARGEQIEVFDLGVHEG